MDSINPKIALRVHGGKVLHMPLSPRSPLWPSNGLSQRIALSLDSIVSYGLQNCILDMHHTSQSRTNFSQSVSSTMVPANSWERSPVIAVSFSVLSFNGLPSKELKQSEEYLLMAYLGKERQWREKEQRSSWRIFEASSLESSKVLHSFLRKLNARRTSDFRYWIGEALPVRSANA